MNKNSLGGSGQAKQKLLTGFINWPIWVMLTKSMLIEKDVWDLISNRSCPIRGHNSGWNKENKEDRMIIGIAQKIIIKGVSSQITFNIMDIDNQKEMWDILKRICLDVGQRVVYLVL